MKIYIVMITHDMVKCEEERLNMGNRDRLRVKLMFYI